MVMDAAKPQGQLGVGPAATQDQKPSIAYKPQGRRGTRAKAPKATGAKRPLKLSVEDEVYERLAVHAMRRKQTISEVVAELAMKHLTDWIIHARPGPKSEAS
jgi:predicted CopG family antitoxin